MMVQWQWSVILTLCVLTFAVATAQNEGFSKHPKSVSVNRGGKATFSCTFIYNNYTGEAQPNIVWNTPPGIPVVSKEGTNDVNYVQSTLTLTAASSSYAGDYQCTVTLDNSQMQHSSNLATLTVNYYSVQFEDRLYTFHESLGTFNVFVATTRVGSPDPSHNATVSFTRDDNGPAINNLIVSTTERVQIEAEIPNDDIRLGDRTIHLTVTTTDNLVEIGAQNHAAVDIIEDDLDPRASISPSVLRVTTGIDAVFMATEYNITTLSVSYTWNYNGSLICNIPNKYSGQQTSKLTIINAQKSDGGDYTCFISIGGASGEATSQLIVSTESVPGNTALIQAFSIAAVIVSISTALCTTH